MHIFYWVLAYLFGMGAASAVLGAIRDNEDYADPDFVFPVLFWPLTLAVTGPVVFCLICASTGKELLVYIKTKERRKNNKILQTQIDRLSS